MAGKMFLHQKEPGSQLRKEIDQDCALLYEADV